MPFAPAHDETEPLQSEVAHGDAYDLVKKLPDNSIDLVLTSPPFWGLRTYGHLHDEGLLKRWKDAGCGSDRVPSYDWYRNEQGILGLEPFPTWYIAHLVEFFNRARRALKHTGSLWINLGDTYFARWSSIRDSGRQGLETSRTRRRTPSEGYLRDKQLLLIPARFAIAMQDAGWILRNDLIWAKPNVMPRPESDRLRLSHEHWFHFVLRNGKGRPKYYYSLEDCEPGARDVITLNTESGSNGHSATFPVDLVRPRILSTTPVGGVVLDPFCGTGRALLEAVNNNRRAIGFELSLDYAETAQRCLLNTLSKHELKFP